MAEDIARAIEAIVMVAEEPVPPNLLAQLLEVPVTSVEEACDALVAAYDNEGRGFVLARVAGGYRFQSHPDLAPYVERFVLEGSRHGCRPRRSRRWRSSPTSSRSPARR